MTTDLTAAFRDLSTPHVADACMRLGLPVRCAPSGMALVVPGGHVFGRALPAQHTGSVDVFLEASNPRNVFVEPDLFWLENAGRNAIPLIPSCPRVLATSSTRRTCPPAREATMPLSLSNTSPEGRPPSRQSPPSSAGRNAAVVR